MERKYPYPGELSTEEAFGANRKEYFKYKREQDIDKFFAYLKAENYPMAGAYEEEISDLVSEFPDLPENYIKFLANCGHGVEFYRGDDYHVKEVKELLSDANFLLYTENDFQSVMPETAFVFWMHGGYQFAFFELEKGDNSPIYFYNEGEDFACFRKVAENFTEFIIKSFNANCPR
jgi:hypothetical protein